MAVEWVNSGAFSQQDIDESKLAVFSQVCVGAQIDEKSQPVVINSSIQNNVPKRCI